MKLTTKTEFADQYLKGEERCTYNRYGEVTRVYIPFTHKTLKIFKEISGADQYTLQRKFEQLVLSWDAKYKAYLEKQKLNSGAELAEKSNIENEQKLHQLSHILAHTLKVNDEVDWSKIKAKPSPPEKPTKRTYPKKPILKEVPFRDPSLNMGFIAFLTGKKKRAHLRAKEDHATAVQRSQQKYDKELKKYKATCEEIDEKYKVALEEHQAQVEEHLSSIEAHNLKIDHLKAKWSEGDP